MPRLRSETTSARADSGEGPRPQAIPPPWPLLEHELRGTVGAIAGLVRLLADGRVPAGEHARVMHSLQNATERAAAFTRDLGKVARWSRPDPDTPRQSVTLGAILDQAIGRVEGSPPIAPELDAAAGDRPLSLMDVEAVVDALAAIARAVRRVSSDGVVCRVRTDEGQAAVMLGPPATAWLPEAERWPFDASTRGGLGLSVLLAVTVVEAHQGRIFQDESGLVVGVCLPLESGRQ